MPSCVISWPNHILPFMILTLPYLVLSSWHCLIYFWMTWHCRNIGHKTFAAIFTEASSCVERSKTHSSIKAQVRPLPPPHLPRRPSGRRSPSSFLPWRWRRLQRRPLLLRFLSQRMEPWTELKMIQDVSTDLKRCDNAANLGGKIS